MVNLHVHNSDSILDGLGTQLQNAEVAASYGQTALCESNHATLSGSLKHIKACNKVGIQPICGIETYFRPNRLVRDKEWRFRKWHMVLLAKNLKGWHNLIKISSCAYADGMYQFPCVDWELMEKFHEGLVCSTSCILGPLPFLIENGSEKEVHDFVIRSQKIFGEDFYIAIMPHDFDRQRAVNLELISLANKFGIPVVYEGDSHYPYKGWVDTQKIAILIGTNSTIADAEAQNKKRIENNEEIYELWHDGLHIMDEKEVSETFARNHPDISSTVVDEAIRNTDYIGSRIEPFLMDRSLKMPRAGKSPGEAESKVIKWCREGLRRCGRDGDPVYEQRLEYELEVIGKRNNFSYIYLVSDWIRWCKSDEPLPGKEGKKRPMLLTCRGSAAASIVCYLTNITAIDPIAHKFKFERFINPERKGQPDIDIDLPSKRRPEAKEYLAIKYGRDSIADIMAQQHFQPRMALKSVTKVLYGFDSEAYNEISYICHDDSGLIDKVHDIDLEKMKERILELKDFSEKWPDAWREAARLENKGDPFVSRLSKHAAGTAIVPGLVTDYMPTIRSDDNEVGFRTAWAETSKYSIVDEIGIVKIDALGISGLDQHEAIIDMHKERTGKEIDIDGLPCLRDPNDVDQDVMALAQQGINIGVNQFSGNGISNYLRKLKPNNIFDLTAANALYRPGGMGESGHLYFSKRKNGEEEFSIPEPLQEVLSDTYGVMAYQESVMSIFQILMGYSAGQADDIRKTIDKENRAKNQAGREKLKLLKAEFIEKASKVIGLENSEIVWDNVLPWTGYGFNRPHAAAYCASSDTEILTKDGWISYLDLSIGQDVMTLNTSTKKSEWKPCNKINVFEHDDIMYEFCTSAHSSLTTFNHRWFVERKYPQKNVFIDEWTMSCNMTNNRRIISAAVNDDLPTKKKYDDALVEIVAWYYTEGTIRKNSDGVAIYQKNYPGVGMIRKTLYNLWGEKKDNFEVAHKKEFGVGSESLYPQWAEHSRNDEELSKTFRINACGGRIIKELAPDKIPSMDFLLSLTLGQLEIFHRISMIADKSSDYLFSQKNKKMAEAFEFVCILLGYSTNFRQSKSSGMYGVYFRSKKSVWPTKTKANDHIVGYKGKVWCPETDNSTWLARRNGKAFYTGNSCEAYKDWHLKKYCSLETYAVILSEFKPKGKLEKEKFVTAAIKEARYFDINILPPDVDISNSDYTPDFENNALRYGLNGIKGIAETSSEQVMKLRPYLSLEDFTQKHEFKYSKVNVGHRKKLLEVGALDSLGGRVDWSDTQKAEAETNLLGMSLSAGGTLGEDEALIKEKVHSEEEYKELEIGSNVVIGGVISEVKKVKTKKGKNPGQEMAFAKIALGLDSFSCTVFPQQYAMNKSLLNVGEKVMINGRKDARGIILNGIMRIDEFIREINESELVAA